MNVMCPISRIDEIDLVVEWGVQEIYFGFNNSEIGINNRRPSNQCNLTLDRNTLETIVEKMKRRNISIYITFNSTVNSEMCVDFLLHKMQECIEVGIHNFIVADINLILAIKKRIVGNYNLILSTCMPVYNQKNIEFFKQLGIKRFVLPRHLLLEEIDQIVFLNEDCEFEVLVKNARCLNEDGNCSFEHGLANYVKGMEGGCCQLKYNVDYVGDMPEDPIIREIIRKRYERVYGNFIFACGACYLKHFEQIGVRSVKIVGREFSTERKLKDISFIRSCLQNIGNPEKEYFEYVHKKYKEVYGVECNHSQCYY